MRYLTPFIQRDLAKKAVLLSGPRQVGKSTLARGLLNSSGVYLNWDIRRDQRVIREESWDKRASLVVLDELHKFPKWKNFLKGVIDQYGTRPPLLVTGSARLEVFRRSGDALTGRTYHYRLHPIDIAEAAAFMPKADPEARLIRLLRTGGFPEAFTHPADAERLRNDRFDIVVREDLRDLSRTNAVRSIELLIELLRERVGSRISYTNLAEAISVSQPTVKSWIELLERLYLVFIVPPYTRGLARSIRREPKVYFYDCAAALDERGARLENAVACALLKYCHWQHDAMGRRLRLHYFRDREGREVDFIVSEGPRVLWCVEVKFGDDAPHAALAYLHQRLVPQAALQLVYGLDRPQESGGIEIVSAAGWLASLPTPTLKS